MCYHVVAYPRKPKNPAAKSVSNIVCVKSEARVFVPEAFNPVSKVEKNRHFKPFVSFVNIKKYEFRVFDRWGEILFKTQSIDESWDGTYKGKLVSEGTYIYNIRYENANGEKVEERGTFVIIYNE